MREDYFTTTELAYLLHIGSDKLRRIITGPFELPAYLVGAKYVIPKSKFFGWYEKMKRERTLRTALGISKVNHAEVYAARDEWLRERYAVTKGVAHHGQP
jgi:hypothetical protein